MYCVNGSRLDKSKEPFWDLWKRESVYQLKLRHSCKTSNEASKAYTCKCMTIALSRVIHSQLCIVPEWPCCEKKQRKKLALNFSKSDYCQTLFIPVISQSNERN